MRVGPSFSLGLIFKSLSDRCVIVSFMSRKSVAMHVDTIRRRHGERVYESQLVRRSVREGKRVRKETVANISGLPPEAIGTGRAFAQGHVAVVLGTRRKLGLERLLGGAQSRERDLILALVCQRLLRPGSKLSATRQFALTTLGEEL